MFKVDFITYQGIYRTLETEKLNVPTLQGRRTILSNHMDIMLSLSVGVIETKEKDGLRHYAVNKGVLYFKDNVAELVSDNIIDVREIDMDRAVNAKKKAEEELETVRRESDRARARDKLEVATMLINAKKQYSE